MKSLMIVLLIIGGGYYYYTEYQEKPEKQGRGFIQSNNNAKQTTKKPTGVIPQHQLQALEKARNVEHVINQSVKDRDI